MADLMITGTDILTDAGRGIREATDCLSEFLMRMTVFLRSFRAHPPGSFRPGADAPGFIPLCVSHLGKPGSGNGR